MTSVTPYLTVNDAKSAIAFYTKAFDAKVIELYESGDRIGHATLRIGTATVYLSDEFPDYRAVSPRTLGGGTAAVVLAVEDPDQVFAQAVAEGAEGYRPVGEDPGGRSGWIEDPFGHRWNIRSEAHATASP